MENENLIPPLNNDPPAEPPKPDLADVLSKVVETIEKNNQDNKRNFEILKKQQDGIAFKVREFEKIKEQPPVYNQPEYDYEADEGKKLKQIAKEIVDEQSRERAGYYARLARERLAKYAKEKGAKIDLTDDYTWQEFINGTPGADNPQERPLYTHRQDPISRCYLDAESPFKDMLEHFNIKYPEYKSGANNLPPENAGEFSLDTTPSSDSSQMSKGSFQLTAIEKEAAKQLGLTEEKYWEIKRGNAPKLNLMGRQK